MSAPTLFRSLTHPAARIRANDRAVGLWLYAVAAMVFAMAVIGAITRLTESGLSIMEWAPVSGALPPLSAAEWERLFELYKTTPEYQQINRGMSMAEFREIFWWEWVHRLWGRLIGVVFLVPFLWFLIRGKIRRGLSPHLAGLFLLGGLQGAMGWYMVASGFAERTDVSQYRLAVHLSIAVVIYAYLLLLAWRLRDPDPEASQDPAAGSLRTGLTALTALAGITILSGAFVAGINAGLIYNSFPLMGGRLVPSDYGFLEPLWLNAFENVAAVQFNHRLLAVAAVFAALALWLWSLRMDLSERARWALGFMALMALAQLGLGIATLLAAVPVWLGALHQAGALLLLGLVLRARYLLRPEG
ncbi:MAG: COX15/CtaA family protein [Rhodovibrionaceae bacterium]|nr:COX15/CtaA family protein [Rhodovibrionaceae bacterium]